MKKRADSAGGIAGSLGYAIPLIRPKVKRALAACQVGATNAIASQYNLDFSAPPIIQQRDPNEPTGSMVLPGSAPGPERFSRGWWDQRTMPIPEVGCHVWMGFVCPQGYARTWYKGKGGVLVHRIAYELAYGPFDESLKVCHRCDVPSCVNPDHLFLGTQKDNLQDMYRKGRGRPFGEPFSGDSADWLVTLSAPAGRTR